MKKINIDNLAKAAARATNGIDDVLDAIKQSDLTDKTRADDGLRNAYAYIVALVAEMRHASIDVAAWTEHGIQINHDNYPRDAASSHRRYRTLMAAANRTADRSFNDAVERNDQAEAKKVSGVLRDYLGRLKTELRKMELYLKHKHAAGPVFDRSSVIDDIYGESVKG